MSDLFNAYINVWIQNIEEKYQTFSEKITTLRQKIKYKNELQETEVQKKSKKNKLIILVEELLKVETYIFLFLIGS